MIEKLAVKLKIEEEPIPFWKLEKLCAKAMIDKVNELIEVYNNIDNAYRKYYQELKDQVEEIKQYLDWDKISGENTAENCKCAKNAQRATNNVKFSRFLQGKDTEGKENLTTEHQVSYMGDGHTKRFMGFNSQVEFSMAPASGTIILIREKL